MELLQIIPGIQIKQRFGRLQRDRVNRQFRQHRTDMPFIVPQSGFDERRCFFRPQGAERLQTGGRLRQNHVRGARRGENFIDDGSLETREIASEKEIPFVR